MPQFASAALRRRALALLATSALAAGISACGDASQAPGETVAVQRVAIAGQPQTGGGVVVQVPALVGKPLRPDVLVSGRGTLSPVQLKQVASLAPGSVAFAAGTGTVNGSAVRVAGVDPLSFRRFTAPGTAESVPVWQVVAAGGVVASHDLAKRLHLVLGQDVIIAGVGGRSVSLRLGALATTGIPGTDLIVDRSNASQLALAGLTAVLLNAGSKDPVSLASRVRQVAGASIEVDLLTAPAQNPVAFLTGSRAAKAFGAFSYKYYPDGTIEPDARWVRESIVSSSVPIFGKVTCHRLMVPQLRGALQDVVNAGLASSLHTYNGCYVPRFIERDPTHAISLHTWGIAIDMDAATNYRGIVGTMDPRVVDIFKRWGFRWGGDWSYSDPMHFELGALLTTSAPTKHRRRHRS